jgi:hypothetical protein
MFRYCACKTGIYAAGSCRLMKTLKQGRKKVHENSDNEKWLFFVDPNGEKYLHNVQNIKTHDLKKRLKPKSQEA